MSSLKASLTYSLAKASSEIFHQSAPDANRLILESGLSELSEHAPSNEQKANIDTILAIQANDLTLGLTDKVISIFASKFLCI
ncbi:hypothetical protein NBRC116188_07130 [Oceaniserpentilla sp. 4NH20-0058]